MKCSTRAGRKLGLAVANMVTLLNPELLIICGEGTDLGDAFLSPVITAVREQTFADLGRQVEVKVQRWGDDAWAVGAATLVLRESFSLPGPDEKSHGSGIDPNLTGERTGLERTCLRYPIEPAVRLQLRACNRASPPYCATKGKMAPLSLPLTSPSTTTAGCGTAPSLLSPSIRSASMRLRSAITRGSIWPSAVSAS